MNRRQALGLIALSIASACSKLKSSTAPSPTPTTLPTSGRTAQDTTLAQMFNDVGYSISAVNYGSRADVARLALNGDANWLIEINGVRIGDGVAPSPTLYMPAIAVAAGSNWQIHK